MWQGSPGAVLQVKLASNADDFCFGKIEYLEPRWEIAVWRNPRRNIGHGVYLVSHGGQDRIPFCRIEIRSLDYLLLILLLLFLLLLVVVVAAAVGVEDDGIAVMTPYADDPRAVP